MKVDPEKKRDKIILRKEPINFRLFFVCVCFKWLYKLGKQNLKTKQLVSLRIKQVEGVII